VPDPTALTDAAIERVTDTLRRELQSAVKIIEQRLSGMDTATELQLREAISRVDNLARLHEEKFAGVSLQFDERDERVKEAAKAAQEALNAALLAAKELVGQQAESQGQASALSAAAFTKLIDQLGLRMEAMQKAYDQQLGEVKDRQTRAEGTLSGGEKSDDTQRNTRGEKREQSNLVIGAVALIITILVIVVPLIAFLASKGK
jgi:hypothetical protein